MSSLTDKRYVQKSKLFLLPLVEVKKDSVMVPQGTYVIDEYKNISSEDCKLIVPFEKSESSTYQYYKSTYILTSSMLDQPSCYETDTSDVYVFDLYKYKEDYFRFLAGLYTEFNTKVKTLINLYWGKKNKENQFVPHPKIDAYINPNEATYRVISDELDIPAEDLMKIGQLIDPPNLIKETLKNNWKNYSENKAEVEIKS